MIAKAVPMNHKNLVPLLDDCWADPPSPLFGTKMMGGVGAGELFPCRPENEESPKALLDEEGSLSLRL